MSIQVETSATSENPLERRQRRSRVVPTALLYQLESAVKEGEMEALVLANDDGLLLASIGDDAVCEELGAYAPLLYQEGFGLELPDHLRDASIVVHPTRIDGQHVFVASKGGNNQKVYHLVRSVRGVERIFGDAA